MEQYISKSAVVAEINRLLAFYSKEIEDNKEDPWAMDIAKRDILQEVLSFLNTLEVKEVDFHKELLSFYRHTNDTGSKIAFAKHFFELGAQKGE